MVNQLSQQDEELLLYNLGKKGFELTEIDYDKKMPLLPTHELIIRIVRDFKDPRSVEGLAVVIDTDPPDYEKLVRDAIKYKVTNQVGYILDGTLTVLKKHKPEENYSRLEKSVETLYKNKLPKNQYLTRINIPNEKEALSRNPAPEDMKWNIIGGVTFKQLDTQYITYRHGAA